MKMNSSESETDEFQTDEDSDYHPTSDSDGTSISTISETYENTSTSDGSLDIYVDSGVFDRMSCHDLSLKIVEAEVDLQNMGFFWLPALQDGSNIESIE